MKVLLALIAATSVWAVKIDLGNDEEINSVKLLDNLFANNKENINEYLDLSDYRENQTFVDFDVDIVVDAFNKTALFETVFGGVVGKINRHGYPVEIHTVTTDDGYILEMHRIPTSPNTSELVVRRPVLLMHGLLDSSSTWVLMGPMNSLAYLLADLGYDVWMGNARGNRYSRNHTTRKPDGNRRERQLFWQFSWHEIGIYDLPAMIDYVLTMNNDFEKIHYIGHSQGTTAFFVMASQRPEYNDKILLMNALAPVAYMTNLRSPIGRAIARTLTRIEGVFDLLGKFEFLPGDDIVTSGAAVTCTNEVIATNICQNILFLICGSNSELFDETQFPLILNFTPSGASTRQLIHYGQLMNTRQFRQYDHGVIGNVRVYGSPRPPIYPINRVTAPVALHYGRNDLLAAVEDVLRLGSDLPNLIGLFPVSHPKFNHLDFVWARNIRELLYERIVLLMRTAETNDV